MYDLPAPSGPDLTSRRNPRRDGHSPAVRPRTHENQPMSVDLRGRHFLKLLDFTPEEALYLLDLSAELKEAKRGGLEEPKLTGKNLALIFEKGSTRTRCAFEVAAFDQGAHLSLIHI